MKDIVFFSNNNNKIKEISNLLKDIPYELLNLNSFEKVESPNESARTFKENAKIKSLFGFKKFNKICFADDSGICIKAMNYKPGISSKEFLNSNKNKNDTLNQIINIAKNKNKFSAYFQTTICLSINKNDHFFFTGKILGRISNKIKGVDGFGYDPIFIPNTNKITFGQMNKKKKILMDHRFLAFKKLKRTNNIL